MSKATRNRSLGTFIYPIRVMGYGLACLTIYLFSALVVGEVSPRVWGLMGLLTLHPHAAFWLYKKSGEKRSIEFKTLVMDMFWISGIATALHFSPVYALPFVVANSATNFATNGPKLLLRGSLSFVSGLLIFGTLLGWHFNVSFDLWTALPAYVYLFAATHHIGFISYVKGKSLRNAKSKIEGQNEELQGQKAALQKANVLVEKKNNDLTASITYAQRIQQAILPTSERLEEAFPEHFLLFRPRDIVSGDLYWLAKHETQTLIAAVDCTGHGIPGAFMSLIANDLLNNIINTKRITVPGAVLDALREGVRHMLHQESSGNQDGMDVSLLCVPHEADAEGKREISYAGAGLSLLLARNGNMERYKGDALFIGGLHPKLKSSKAKTYRITLLPDTWQVAYLFSDGFQDQFGGAKNRKFLSSRFRETLLEVYQSPLSEQQTELEKRLDAWQKEGEEEQIDDILVMGLRL